MLLSNLHHSAKRLLAWVILPLISVSFIFFGIQSYLHIYSDDNHAVTVNGVTIPQRQVERAYERARVQFAQQQKQDHLSPSVEKQLKVQARERLIVQELLKQTAHDMGYRISMPLAKAALMEIPAFQENGEFSEAAFQQALSSNMYTQKGFLTQLQTNMLISQLQSGVVRTAFVLPKNVERSLSLLEQKRDIQYLLIPSSKFKNDIQISDEKLEAYYQAHKADYKTPEQVSIEYLKLSLPDFMKQVTVTDAELKSYYNDYKDNYRTIPEYRVAHILVKLPANASLSQVKAAQAKVEKIQKDFAAGADFSKLAKAHSDDKLTAKEGGLLPWFKPGTFDKNFERAAMRLTKVNEVSPAVRTQYGYNLIQLRELKPSKVIAFDKVKSKIERSLRQDKAQKAFAQANDVLASESFSSPDSLTAAAAALKLPVKSTELFSKEGQKGHLSENVKVRGTAFSEEVLAGNNSDVIQIDAESVMVLRVKQHKPASVKAFKDVKATIKEQMVKEAMILQARDYAEKLMVMLEKKQNPAKLMKQYGLNWQLAMNVSRQDAKLNAEIVKTAFEIAPPVKGVNKPSKMVTLNWGDIAVVQLNKIVSEKADLTDKQRQDFTKNMAYGQGMMEFDLFVKGLEKNAKIERHQ